MKTIIIIILFFQSTLLLFGQENFYWEKIDSTNKSKSQIYSDTKLFIAEYWKSSKDVIQNDDKEGGVVLIKGTLSCFETYGLIKRHFVYSYNVKFFMKENKFRLIIDNVHCLSHTDMTDKYVYECIEPVEKPTEKVAFMPIPKMELLMGCIKSEIQSIVDVYVTKIKSESKDSKDKW